MRGRPYLLAVDQRGGRVFLVDTEATGEVLSLYRPSTGEVTCLLPRLHDTVPLHEAMAYDPESDHICFIGKVFDNTGRYHLIELTTDGAVVSNRALEGPLFPGMFGHSPYDLVQLVAVNHTLVLSIERSGVEFEDTRSPSSVPVYHSLIYCIDPATAVARVARKQPMSDEASR